MAGSGVANLGPEGRRRRLAFGIASLLVASAALVALVLLDAGRGWRLLLAPPLWGAALGVFQYRENT